VSVLFCPSKNRTDTNSAQQLRRFDPELAKIHVFSGAPLCPCDSLIEPLPGLVFGGKIGVSIFSGEM
jgi:hypothetical protein